MRVAFVGATRFSLNCLHALHGLPTVEVVAVITAAREFRISYSANPVDNVMHADLGTYGEEHKIPVHTLGSSMKDSGLESKLFAGRPDFVFVAGWYHMIPGSWLARAPIFGLHASLLPKYRGGAPLVWAMINGESKTGVSLFQMDHGVDTGPVLSTREIPIGADDEIGDLLERAERASIDIIRRDFPRIASGEIKGKAQPAATFPVMPQRSPSDGRIDWTQSSEKIGLFVRAQTRPYPGAFLEIEKRKVAIWGCVEAPEITKAAEPGSVARCLKHFYIKSADSWIRLTNFDLEDDLSEAEKLLQTQAEPLGQAN